MTEYNLTWTEAKEALKRGAIIESESGMTQYKDYDDFGIDAICCSYRKSGDEWRPTIAITEDAHNKKWRIAELTDCEIIELGVIYGRCHLECKAHFFTLAYHINCESKNIPKLKQECITTIKNFCIEKFTEQLKKDVKLDESKKVINQIVGSIADFKEFKKINEDIYRHQLLHGGAIYFYKEPGANHWRQEEGVMRDKVYTFEEAITGMRQGKFYKSNGYIRKIENGKLYLWARSENKWIENESFLHSLNGGLLNGNFIEVENLENKETEQKGNELKLSEEDFWQETSCNLIEVGEENFYAENQLIASRWMGALNAFMKLKSHPLSKKPSKDNAQFYIAYDAHIGLVILDHDIWSYKIDFISPMFSTEGDARHAIDDVGKDNILNMFKTFGGDYE